MSTDTGRLTDAMVRALQPPERGNRITYDKGRAAVRGFGIRVTAAGAKSFILNYTIAGRERRLTIGSYPAWTVTAAREEAKVRRQQVDRGEDPLGDREALRDAPTVAELCDRYLAEHAIKKRTEPADKARIDRVVRPELGSRKVAGVTYSDVDRLHRKVTREKGPYTANRLLSLCSKMFTLAIRWGMRADNPCKGIERNPEEPRYRYLTGDEVQRLTEALAAHPDQQAANVLRLLLLTGARRGEVLEARWDQFNLAAGVWTKPSSHVKQKREHRVPLSAPVQQLLAEIKRGNTSPYLFPGQDGAGPRGGIYPSWAEMREAAQLAGVRVHDLRHSYASVLASAGLSLPVIGALLGHSRAQTSHRYAHLHDDPLRAATERAGAIITGNGDDKPSAEVVPIRGGAR